VNIAATTTGSAAAVEPDTVRPARVLGHVPELDGIRGLAVLVTVVAHSFFLAAPGGGLTGVAVFFTLSGFLITTLLAEEWGRHGRIDLPRFYMRRALRLLPALFVVLIVYLVLAYVAFNPVALHQRLDAALYVATYFGNWQNATGSNLADLSHTWSLAVEDQFYFIWPPVLALALVVGFRQRTVLALTLFGALGLMVLRATAYAAGTDWDRIYYGTDMVGSSLLIGCLAALAVTWGYIPPLRHGRAAAALALLALALSTFTVSQHEASGRAWLATVGFPGIALASAALIVAVVGDPRAAPILGHPVLRFFGRISYALYLWHLLIIHILAKIFGVSSLERSMLSIPLAIGAATLSYVLVERPFLRLKDRVGGPGRRRSPADVAAETAAGAAGGTGPVDPTVPAAARR
jgi:peptidoglycan/LPS O-acetylase OafA/YrhL